MGNLKRKNGSGTTCAVVGCTNSRKHLNEWLDRECFDHKPATKRQCPCPPFFTFFRKPDTDSESRAWLKALDLKKPPRNVFVCSHHFADKRPTEDHPFPELWLGYNRFTRPKRRQLTERTAASPQRKKRRLQSEDVQQLIVIKEEVPWSSSVDQQDPEPVHIKEEEEELWSRREGEQLHGQEETDISRFSVTAVTVKSEDEDEEKPQSSQLLQIKTEDSRETEPETGLNHDGGCNTARKSFSCSDCSKQFVHERSLKIHMRVHTGDPPFGCDVCGKRFSQNGLKIHMRVHTRPKPFVCDVCGKTFRRETHLESHMRFHEENHHLAVMIVKDYFAKNTDLKKHLQPEIR